jgi:hypothetical protein
MFLTPEELHALTDYKRPCDQMRWLREHGYPFEIGASGRPKVLRRIVEQRYEARPASPKLRLA